MKCSVCGKESFIRGEYRMEGGTAPALQCTCCGALNLDEAAAETALDRSSVRMAAAARAAVVESESSVRAAIDADDVEDETTKQ
ncbi:MAG TPA: hypothetical protein VGM06_05750 [Polyangiaceae bacterium]|jgi:hypothetical protein